MDRRTAKQPLALRARPATLESLRRRARDSGQSQAALAERYIEEGIRTDEHPLITFTEGAAGRRPALVGTRLDVWQVIETLRQNGNSLEETAAYLAIPEQHVRACIAYYADYQAEIDDWARQEKEFAEREEKRWQRAQAVLR